MIEKWILLQNKSNFSKLDINALEANVYESRKLRKLYEQYVKESSELSETKMNNDVFSYQIELEIIKLQEELYNLRKNYRYQLDSENEVLAYGSFMNDTTKQICKDLIRMSCLPGTEFEADELLFCGDLFSGGANLFGSKYATSVEYYRKYLRDLESLVQHIRNDIHVENNSGNKRKDLQKVRSEISKLKTLIVDEGDTKQAIRNLNRQLKHINEEINENQEYINSHTSYIPVLNGPPTSPNDNDENFDSFTIDGNGQLAELGNELKNLREEQARLEKEVAAAQEAMESECAKNEAVEKRAEELKENAGPLYERYQEMKRRYISLDTFRNILEIVAREKEELNEKDEEARKTSQEIKRMKERIRILEQQEMDCDEHITRLKAQIDE